MRYIYIYHTQFSSVLLYYLKIVFEWINLTTRERFSRLSIKAHYLMNFQTAITLSMLYSFPRRIHNFLKLHSKGSIEIISNFDEYNQLDAFKRTDFLSRLTTVMAKKKKKTAVITKEEKRSQYWDIHRLITSRL